MWTMDSRASCGVDHVLLFTFSATIKMIGGDGEGDGQLQPQEKVHNMAKASQCPLMATAALFIMKP